MTDTESTIESALRLIHALPPDEAIDQARHWRERTHQIERAAHARRLREVLPDVATLDACAEAATGDDGTPFLAWASVTVVFTDGRKLTLSDLGVTDSGGAWLYPGGAGNTALAVQIDGAGLRTDEEVVEFERRLIAEVFRVPADQLTTAIEALWALIFTDENQAADSVLEIAQIIADADHK